MVAAAKSPRLADAAPRLSAAPLEQIAGVGHGFFTRRGGASEGLFASLNCGYGSKDAPDKVTENRARAMAALGLAPERLVTAFQVHSPDCVTVTAPWRHADSPDADALVTDRPGLALGVLTADCAPVLLASRGRPAVGAAHAGWKGALGGVLDSVVAALGRLGARPEELVAVIGPSIAQASYEVGPEFPEPFLAQDPENAGCFVASDRPGHFRFDLPGYAARRLRLAGVGRVEAMGRDTCAEAADFFSYRRACLAGEPRYGRGLSAIALEQR